MDQVENYRLRRVERLLDELRYEVELGIMQGEIDERIDYNFVVPCSKNIKNGIVLCKFESTPVHHFMHDFRKHHLQIVTSGVKHE